jgi:hypothetical protein
MDVDGVVCPYPPIYCGESKDLNLKNFEDWREKQITNPANFPVDHNIDVCNSQFFKPAFSKELTDNIATLIKGSHVNFYWLTAWQSEASRLACEDFGWSFKTNHIILRQSHDNMKWLAVQESLALEQPIVWVDDDYGPRYGDQSFTGVKIDVPHLFIKPNSQNGLNSEEWERILGFVALNS